MGVKLGFSYQGKNADWGCPRTGRRGENPDTRAIKWQELQNLYCSLTVI